jgi:hypothetical protein
VVFRQLSVRGITPFEALKAKDQWEWIFQRHIGKRLEAWQSFVKSRCGLNQRGQEFFKSPTFVFYL